MASVTNVVTRYKQALTIPREYHLPAAVRGKEPIVPEGTDLMIWTWEEGGDVAPPVYLGIAFAGKANKPLWYYTFRKPERLQAQIDETIKNRKAILKYKQDRQDERKNFEHTYKEGDILYTSWGYDQTNVDFYQVIDVKGAVLVIRQVSKVVKEEGRGSDQVVAKPNSFVGAPMRVKPGVNGTKIDGHHGSLWDGRPKHQTPFGMGH